MQAPTPSHDVIVIGAGQAGPGVAAARAGTGKKVALVEMDRVGGTCLNHGCRPTKALRASALAAHRARQAGAHGVRTGEVSVDFGQAIGRMHTMIEEMRQGLLDWVTSLENLELVTGRATLVSDPTGAAHQVLVAGRTLSAPEVYLDVGARASIPPIPGLDEVDYLTETELLAGTECPQHLVIVGGGYIGLELGQAYRRLGAQVTMLVGRGVATREDPDVAAILTEVLTAEGVRILPTRPSAVARSADGGIAVSIEGEETIYGSHLLLATGRTSNADLLGEGHQLATDDRGFITIGPRYETSVPGIWALGDVNGHGAFTHTAYQDSQILLDPGRSVTGRVSTYAMFTDPPLGRVGMNLAQARASGRRVLVAEVPMSRVTRAVLEGETTGVLRLLADADTTELLGATILGLHADDLVQIISLAMQAGLGYPVVRDMLPIHPTMAEFLPSLLGALEPLH